jgi:hypothetical protein
MSDETLPAMDDVPGPAEPSNAAERGYSPHELEFLREVTTMALYVSLSLIAVLIALPDVNPAEDNRVEEGVTVLIAGLGLVLAHHVAFRMSTRLVNQGLLTSESRNALKAQALGGLPVAVLGALPVFLLGESPGEDVAILVLLGLVVAVGYRTARFSSRPIRALAYSAIVVVIVLAVVGVKLIVGH